MTKIYRVNVRRDGRWWFFDIPDVDMGGQARRLDEVAFEAGDIISTWLRIEPESFEVSLNVDIPADARAAWQEAKKRETVARTENAAAASLARQAVARLRADGLTLAETGHVLGISTQRASQLSAGTQTRPPIPARETVSRGNIAARATRFDGKRR